MISFRQKGDFSKTYGFLERAKEVIKMGDLDKYGREGVIALSSATPENTGETANSWYYEIERKQRSARIIWKNSHMSEGIPIAILLQYGHATKNGGFVQGRDYINPSMRPVFDSIAESAWKEVINNE